MPELTPEERAAVEEVRRKLTNAETGVHKTFTDRASRYYSLYRNYTDWRKAVGGAGPRDRDDVIKDGRREFGAELFIPLTYSVVETLVPRVVSHRPRMLTLPAEDTPEENVRNMRMLIDRQQEQIDYELVLQDVLKAGLIYELGVQKTGWRYERTVRRALKPSSYDPDTFVQGTRAHYFDDPFAEDVDPFDFFWDPYASSMDNCEWAIHRTWRSHRYVMSMIERGQWRPHTEDEIRATGPRDGSYDAVWAERMRAAGHKGDLKGQGEHIHEVWEFHDCHRVITVLDAQHLVHFGSNPAWHGELPFQVFRPIRVPHQMVGIGVVSPIEHLQYEMNTLRSQRRDNASFVLQQPFAYYDGLVDPEMFKFGPGVGIPVDGNPRELLYPLNVGDIPNSGYREEERLQADVERTSGISDVVAGGDPRGGVSETATGAQLVVAAANERIKNIVRRLEVEVIRPAARQWISLNQQHITTKRDVQVPDAAEPGNLNQRWKTIQMGPAELAGQMKVVPDGGATAPNNVPQDRQDAQMLWQMFNGNQQIEQRTLQVAVLDKMGIKQAESWLTPPQPQVPAQTLALIRNALVESGTTPPDKAQQLIDGALQQAQQQPQGPGPPAVPPPPEEQSQNGRAPQPAVA